MAPAPAVPLSPPVAALETNVAAVIVGDPPDAPTAPPRPCPPPPPWAPVAPSPPLPPRAEFDVAFPPVMLRMALFKAIAPPNAFPPTPPKIENIPPGKPAPPCPALAMFDVNAQLVSVTEPPLE